MEISQTQAFTIYTEASPNPNSLKFVANTMLIPEKVSRDYVGSAGTGDAPLAAALFERFDFITRIFYMSNFVTITKKEETDWFEVKGTIQHFIKDFLEGGGSVLTEEIKDIDPELNDSDTDIEVKIKGILDEYIKPAVEMDGGAISFHSFNEGKVTVTLQGSCSGCPSSTVTLKAGIENLLRKMLPEVNQVEALEA